ncbi:MAG TPA: SGNH/GDSL hydrolase family protein [Candidatus Saccharimonadales bacterium]|nr:SGNH/GDSL hydrolase family protein [Candidatus Saccharimonadales bacterium]
MVRRIAAPLAALLSFVVAMLPAAPAQADASAFPVRAASGGESFAAGDGGIEFGGYLKGTNTPQNRCHRSNSSATQLLATAGFITLAANTACSGATIDTFMATGQYNEPAQITRIPTGLDVYFLSLGGNDVGYGTVAGCILRTNCTKTAIPSQSMQLIAGLGPRLDTVYAAIRAKVPNGRVIVQLYPLILPLPNAKPGPLCPYLQPGEAKIGYDLTTQLNAVIKARAQAHGFVVANPVQRFVGHDVCSLTSYFYYPGLGASFHPNVLGRFALGWTDITTYINSN